MNTIISPNMGLPVPVVGVEPGPDWATDVNACMSAIDSHNHSSGQGVQITPSGLNINSDLTMNSNDLIATRTVRFTPQAVVIPASSPDLGCIYVSGVDLYYNDGSGSTPIRITQGGSVTGASGTISGLPSGTASASYAAGVFTFQSATNTPATMSGGTVIIGQNVASGKTVTIAANGAQASNYALTLPLALPSVQSSVVSDASGNLSFVGISAATYSPALTNSTNITSSSNLNSFYTRTGNFVTVNCVVSIGPTAAGGAQTVMLIALPIASTLTNTYDLTGVGQSESNTNTGAFVQANTGTNSASYTFSSGSTGTSRHHIIFSYQVV